MPMKTTMLTLLAVVISFAVYSQKQTIEFSITSPEGHFFVKDADVYTLSPIKIIGLKSDADYVSFEKKVKKQAVVKKFEYLPEKNEDGTKNAMLCITKNDEATIENLLKAINVTKLTVNDKSFMVPEQKEDLKNYLKELKEKHKPVQTQPINERRVVKPRVNQSNE